MSSDSSPPGDHGIDPMWWANALAGVGEFETPEVLAIEFEARLKQDDLGALERQVFDALAMATSAMLEPENWQEPFKPATIWGDRRSALPKDLSQEQLVLLAEIAPVVEHPSLQARIADVAWFYGNRGAVDLLELAIDTYRSFPLDERLWARGSHDAWQRALQLARRLGSRRAEVLGEMTASMQNVILGAAANDGYFIPQVSQLLSTVRVAPASARELGDHLTNLAAEVCQTNPRLSRHLERQASAWFADCGEEALSRDCVSRIADTYALAAEARMAADDDGALAAALDIEKAIATIRTLPRSYRQAYALDIRVNELSARLEDMRHATLEAMVTIEGDPIDLSEYVRQAQATVSGRQPLEALVRFTHILPLTNKEEAFTQARERSTGSISALFPRATFSSDGRKVAASGGTDDDGFLWAQVVRDFGHRVSLTTAGLILPAREQLMAEQRYPSEYLGLLCLEAPTVPPGHEQLWARGLWHGFNDDFPSAVSVLVPQLEHAVRFQLNRRGITTKVVDDATGVETEKGLGTLLIQDGVEELLGSGLTTELRALLLEKEGANLRNEIAHGLFTDDASWSYSAIYCWWLLLRLVVAPVWRMRRPPGADADIDED